MFHRIGHDSGSGCSAVCDEERMVWFSFSSVKNKLDYCRKQYCG